MSGASGTLMLLRMGFSLAFILGMIWLAARVLRRRGKLGAAASTELELVSRRSMGRRSNLVVVRVAGRTLLVGATDTQISLVADLSGAPEPDVDLTDSTGAIESAEVIPATFPVLRSAPSAGDLLEAIRSRTARRA